MCSALPSRRLNKVTCRNREALRLLCDEVRSPWPHAECGDGLREVRDQCERLRPWRDRHAAQYASFICARSCVRQREMLTQVLVEGLDEYMSKQTGQPKGTWSSTVSTPSNGSSASKYADQCDLQFTNLLGRNGEPEDVAKLVLLAAVGAKASVIQNFYSRALHKQKVSLTSCKRRSDD